MSKIVGVSFPIPKPLMGRFFKDGKTVFIKPATVFKEIKCGMKFVFYQSHEETGYVGEALIEKIEIDDDPFSFFETYGDAIFLTREEVKDYLEQQRKWKIHGSRKRKEKNRNWIAITLRNIQQYEMIIKPDQFVPVGGKYLKE